MGERRKPVNLNLQFGFNTPTKHEKMTRFATGEYHIYDKEGKRIIPDYAFRIVYRNRPNKPDHPKIYSIMPIDPANMSDNGLTGAVTQYDTLYAIDTGPDTIGSDLVHAACFIAIKFNQLQNRQIEALPDNRVHILEFRNIAASEKPENIAWKQLIKGINSNTENLNKKIGIVTDSDLNNIEAYNRGIKPITGEFFLPSNIDLIYATSDTSVELVNQLVRFSDRGAKRFLRDLKSGACHPDNDLEIHAEEPYTGFRFWTMNGEWSMDKTILDGMKILGGKIELWGMKN